MRGARTLEIYILLLSAEPKGLIGNGSEVAEIVTSCDYMQSQVGGPGVGGGDGAV